MIGLAVYWVIFGLMMIGLYITIADGNLIKKVIGLTVFQVSVFMLYIAIANVEGASVPILEAGVKSYSNPLPHVLILTAIVVGIATVALALALIVRIRESFGTIEESELDHKDSGQHE
ncbi:MAG: multicomponent Na+:H+ antiporter subunit C [Patiriisocius sp.]|jgi:multicomponent Na+:H+ antiporter subunit C